MILLQRFQALTGWRRGLALFGLGALAVLALPPVGLLPVMLVCFPPLVWEWQQAPTRRMAFMRLWLWNLGFYALGFYWIANALLIEAAKFAWMIPFATLGLGGVVALFPAATLTAVWGLRVWGRASQALVFAIAWAVAEWLRSFVMTGLPWNPLGSVWDDLLPMLQVGALVGVNGLTALTALMLALLAVGGKHLRWASVGLVLVLGLGGAIRLSSIPLEFVPGAKIRLVQPNASQDEKWLPANREPALLDMVALSQQEGWLGLKAVVWPESSVAFDLKGDVRHRVMASHAAPPGGLLLAGAPRLEPKNGGGWNFWNSLMIIDTQGQLQGVYDKAHLVPFGEYVPLRAILPLPAVAASMGDFSPGPGPHTLDVPGMPALGTAICYESIFSGEVVEKGDRRPGWLVVITNDGWFGQSAGPYQHFAAGRMRAIEEGLPVARAANTGVSGMIDAVGRVVAKTPLGVKTVLDSDLPVAIEHPTLFARFGSISWMILLAFMGVSAFFGRRYN